MRSRTTTLTHLHRGALVLCACVVFHAHARAQTPPATEKAAPPKATAPEAKPAQAETAPAKDEAPPEDTSSAAEAGEPTTDVTGAQGDAAAEGSIDTEVSADTSGAVVESGAGLFEQTMAGGDEGDANDDGGTETPSFELGGYVRSDVFVGEDPGSEEAALQAGYSELALKVQGPREKYGSAFAEARLRYGQQLDQRDLIIDLREAYVDLWLGPLDFRLGQQIIVWGRADAFNPTNNLLPLDFRIRSPVEDDRRLGSLGVRAFYNIHPIRIEAVWLPLYAATEYPPIELEDYIVLLDPVFPGPELKHGLGGGRVHLELPSVEASVSYVNGHAPMPGLNLVSYSIGPPASDPNGSDLGADPPEVRVARTAYRQHIVGADFSTAVSDLFAVRAETAYRRPNGYQSRLYAARPDLQYVVGLDRAFGSVTVIVQYMGRYVFDWQREDGPDDPVDPNALLTFMPPLPQFVEENIETQLHDELAMHNQILFSQTERVQHAVTIRPEWLTLHDTLSLSALVMVNFSTEEMLFFPKVEYRISDALRGTVGGEIFVGPENTLFDLIDHSLTAGYAELRYSF